MASAFQGDAIGKLILRLALGILMLFHGISKVLNPAGAIGYVTGQLAAAGLPGFLVYGVFVGEVVAPILIILGLYSRLGGLIVVINMVFAIVLSHSAQLFQLTKTGGWALELQAFYLFTGLALCFMGSGKLAVKAD